MKNYYKRINKSDYEGASIKAIEGYENLKSANGVIVSNDENGEFILVPTELIGEFIVTYLSREDIEKEGFDASVLSDEDMNDLADSLEDGILDDGIYWYLVNSFMEDNFGQEANNEED